MPPAEAERRHGDRAVMVEVVALLGEENLRDFANYLAYGKEETDRRSG